MLQRMAAPRQRKWMPFAVAGLALALAGAGLGAYALSRPEPADGSITACQDAVREQLKTPATAKFSEDRVVEQSGATFYVHGIVDAENSFGATLRNRYQCIANQSGTRWQVVDVSLLEWP
jgi:hypothetical protein